MVSPAPSGIAPGNSGGMAGQNAAGYYGYGGPAYGVPGAASGYYGAPSSNSSSGVVGYGGYGPAYGTFGPGYGTFGPGYPGYGLEYVHGCALGSYLRNHPGEFSAHNWCSYVLGRECLYPYVADPYTDPAAALGFWPPYSAPVASPAPAVVRRSDLGIDEEPVVDAAGARGMKVARVYPGTAAAKAGIQAGDVLHSINGYLTQQRGNLAWIVAHAAPERVLEIRLRSVRDGQERTITAQVN
jgi:PDZ domain